jgi:hypothetical protein
MHTHTYTHMLISNTMLKQHHALLAALPYSPPNSHPHLTGTCNCAGTFQNPSHVRVIHLNPGNSQDG